MHGGSARTERETFLRYLRSTEIKDPTGEQGRPRRWADRLRDDLGSEYEVFTPTMPNKYDSRYEEWKIWFERHFEWLKDDVVLVGWSQGSMFFAKYLIEEELPFVPKALFLLAPPIGRELHPDVEYYGEDGGDFIFDEAALPEITKKVGEIHIFHSEDDFVVPFAHAERYAAALPEAKLHRFTDKNHFLVEELPELIDEIKKI